MRKFLFSIVALLLMVGVASAASIPGSIDPTAGPEVWVTDVYNNSGSTLDIGDVVVWEIDASTGDNDNYIQIDKNKEHRYINQTG